jgi:hypothetical protein
MLPEGWICCYLHQSKVRPFTPSKWIFSPLYNSSFDNEEFQLAIWMPFYPFFTARMSYDILWSALGPGHCAQ